jgi:hypothetical protein
MEGRLSAEISAWREQRVERNDLLWRGGYIDLKENVLMRKLDCCCLAGVWNLDAFVEDWRGSIFFILSNIIKSSIFFRYFNK